MRKKHIFKISVTLAVLLLSGMLVHSHSGRTDKYGGHHDRINGGYHFHNKGTVKPSIPKTKDITAKSLETRLSDEWLQGWDPKAKPITPKADKSETPDRRFKVHVDITGSDNTTKSMIESHIKRELRSLGDVDIVDKKDAKYILRLVAIAHTYKSTGNKTGRTSITVNTLTKFDYQIPFRAALGTYINTYEKDLTPEERVKRYKTAEELAEIYGTYFSAYLDPQLNLIVNIPNNNLPDTCKEIVAEFDVLENRRKLLLPE